MVLKHIQLVMGYILRYRQHFISVMEQQLQLESVEKLQTSRKQLEAEVVALRQEIEVQERQNENIERFIRTADKYVDIEEIDPCILRELIKAIYVEASDKSSGKHRQNIHIQYDGIGFSLWKNLRKRKRRDRSHAVP